MVLRLFNVSEKWEEPHEAIMCYVRWKYDLCFDMDMTHFQEIKFARKMEEYR